MYWILIAAITLSFLSLFVSKKSARHDVKGTGDTLAREIAHDIKNPLAALLSNASLLQEHRSKFSVQDREIIDRIATCATYVHNLLETFLDVSEHSVFKRKTLPQRVFLCDLTREIFSLLQPIASYNQIKLENKIAPECMVFTDQIQCKQILFNVIHNAIKYCAPNGYIYIDAIEQSTGVTMTIEDTGHGIPQDVVDAVLGDEPHQLSSRDASHGYGLGLRIIKTLIEHASGSLHIISGPGGTTISIRLPTEKVYNSEKDSSMPDTVTLLGKKLLLIQKNASDTEDTLSTFGAIVQKTSAISDALTELTQRRFDIVLIDDDLELSTGYALAKLIKDDLKASNTEVMILSRADFNTQEASEFGVDGYINKPLRAKQLPDLHRI